MHIASPQPEKWDLLNRGVDRETGFEMCHVRQQTPQRIVVYRLVLYSQGWRKVGDILPHFKGFRRYPEGRGVKLSNSRVDLTLLSFAETSHGSAYA